MSQRRRRVTSGVVAAHLVGETTDINAAILYGILEGSDLNSLR